jgi:RNA polymerase sigma factor (sigma-70 family)
VDSEDDAADIVQDVFVNVWHKRESLNPEGHIEAYLFTTAKNLALNWKRNRRKNSETFDESFSCDDSLENFLLTKIDVERAVETFRIPAEQSSSFTNLKVGRTTKWRKRWAFQSKPWRNG